MRGRKEKTMKTDAVIFGGFGAISQLYSDEKYSELSFYIKHLTVLSSLLWGCSGRRFKSCYSDQFS
jgi:hypothetical protein